MPRWSGLIGAMILVGGLIGVAVEDSSHNACNSGLGASGQAVIEGVARSCGIDNGIYYLAILAAIVGLALMVAAVLVKS